MVGGYYTSQGQGEQAGIEAGAAIEMFGEGLSFFVPGLIEDLLLEIGGCGSPLLDRAW
jgi:hypothetical protein